MIALAKMPWGLIGVGALALSAAVSASQWYDTHSKISTLRGEHAALVTSYAQCSVDLDAERRNASDALLAQIEANRRAAELGVKLDAATRAAQEARGEVVTRTVEVIRNATSLSACPIPDAVRAARLRQWCSARPERSDSPHCNGSPANERDAG